MILDTQYLGALADGDEAAREKARELAQSVLPARVQTAVVWQVDTDIENAPLEEQGEKLHALYERLIASRSPVDLAPEVALWAEEVNGEQMKADVPKDYDGPDSVVAAHGLLLCEAVVSNDSDVQDVEALEVETD